MCWEERAACEVDIQRRFDDIDGVPRAPEEDAGNAAAYKQLDHRQVFNGAVVVLGPLDAKCVEHAEIRAARPDVAEQCSTEALWRVTVVFGVMNMNDS